MQKWCLLIFLAGLLVLSACSRKFSFDNRSSRNNNVCKQLRGKVVLFLIFIDRTDTLHLTQGDLQGIVSTSRTAASWLETEAAQRQVPLDVDVHFVQHDTIFTVNRRYPKHLVCGTKLRGWQPVMRFNKYTDPIARMVGKELSPTTDQGIPKVKNAKNKERLIAYLRDKYQAESVALLFFVHDRYETNVSLTLNTRKNRRVVEYTMTSHNNATVIAHQVLQLFGAVPFYKPQKPHKVTNKAAALQHFPDDIMLLPFDQSLNSATIGELTAYLIGWGPSPLPQYKPLAKPAKLEKSMVPVEAH